MIKQALAGILVVVGLSGVAFGARKPPLPHAAAHNVLMLVDGTRIELKTNYRVRLVQTTHAGAATTVSWAAIDLDITHPRDDGADETPPVHLRMEGQINHPDRSIDPCWMPAMLLMAIGAADEADLERELGFTPASLRVTGNDQAPDRLVIFRVLDLLMGQVWALNPGRAPMVQRLIDSTLGPAPVVEPAFVP